MAPTLTQADVARLLAEPSAQMRAEVAEKLGRDIDSPNLSEKELRAAQDILRIMAKDIEVTVRSALSRSLRQATRLPHDVAMTLATDVEAVALPILSHSLVLTEQDLVQIVRRGSPTKQAAIAGRPDVTDPVSTALVTVGHETAVTALMRNSLAVISEQSLNRAIDRFPDSDDVKEGMVRREALPITVTERLVVLVSDRLRDYLVVHHKLPAKLATDIVLQSRERATLNLSSGIAGTDLNELVGQMYRSGRLSSSLVLRALCIGDMAFFETAMAVMAGVKLENAKILIHDGGRMGLASLYEKSGLSPSLFPAFRAAADVVDSTKFDGEARDMERFRARVISLVLTQFEDFDQEDLDYLVAKLGDVLATA
jgi:uncharacterized protein (DUF2336 family)